MRVELTEQNLRQALRVLDVAPGRARMAISRAMNEAIRWGRTQVRRDVSREAQIPQKLLSGRIFLNQANRRQMRASLWTGLNPIRAIDAGKARQTRTGVRVGRHQFPGAFLATMPEGHEGVFLREGAKRPMSKGRYVGKMRQPIVEQTISLSPSPGTVERIEQGLLTQFNQRAERLLGWEMEKAGKGQP